MIVNAKLKLLRTFPAELSSSINPTVASIIVLNNTEIKIVLLNKSVWIKALIFLLDA